MEYIIYLKPDKTSNIKELSVIVVSVFRKKVWQTFELFKINYTL